MTTDKDRTETTAAPTSETPAPLPEPAFGWTVYAEQINGRFAMLGIVLLLAIEFVTGQTLFTWLGLR